MNKLILIACIALFLATGCKSRKVLTTRLDSTVVTRVDKVAKSVETKIDTGKIITQKITNTKDSSTTVIEATPEPGTTTTIGKDGTITGKFSNVKYTNNKKVDTKQTENINEQKGAGSTKQMDSTVNINQQTHVEKKIKSVDAKPKPGIWPLVIPIIILGAICLVLWWFFGRPKGSK